MCHDCLGLPRLTSAGTSRDGVQPRAPDADEANLDELQPERLPRQQ